MSLFVDRRRGIPRDVGIWCGCFSILSILKAGMCAGCPPPWRFVHAINSTADQPTHLRIRVGKWGGAFVGAIEAVPMNRGGTSIRTRRLLRRHNSRRHPCDDVVVGLLLDHQPLHSLLTTHYRTRSYCTRYNSTRFIIHSVLSSSMIHGKKSRCKMMNGQRNVA